MEYVRHLGEGGLGTVSLQKDTDGCLYAVKHMRTSWNLGLRQRFCDEMRIMQTLSHPCIVPLIGYDAYAREPWYIMPYYPQGTLRDALNRLLSINRLPAARKTVRLIHQIADALEHAHAHRIIHRDFKPENVLFDGPRPIVADWGIAKSLRKGLIPTQSGLGTRDYCAPEQWSGKAVSERSDIYSLGLVFRELLTGSVTGHVLCPRLNAVICRMTQQCPADRYASMAEVKHAIFCATVEPVRLPPFDFVDGLLVTASVGLLAYALAKN